MPVNRRRRHLWIVPAAFAVLPVALTAVLSGCGDEPVTRPMDLPSGATYVSPAGNFTAVVPALLGPDLHRSQTTGEEKSPEVGVTFADDFGTLLDVQSRRVANDANRPAYPAADRSADVGRYFDAVVLPALRRRSPGATVLHRADDVLTAAGPALFAVVGLPGGSTRVLRNPAGRPYHPDAVRGILVFPQYRWVYAVGVQQWPPTPDAPALAPADRDAGLLADLRQTVARMTFN